MAIINDPNKIEEQRSFVDWFRGLGKDPISPPNIKGALPRDAAPEDWQAALTGEKTNETMLNLLLTGVPAAGKALEGSKLLKHLTNVELWNPAYEGAKTATAGLGMPILSTILGSATVGFPTILSEQLSNLIHGKVDMPTKEELSNYIRGTKGQPSKESFESRPSEYRSKGRILPDKRPFMDLLHEDLPWFRK